MTQPNGLTPDDLAAIEAAVREAEARTTGEIYCVVAQSSSDYGETPLAWAAGVTLLVPAVLLLAGVHVSAPDLSTGWSMAQAATHAARDALIGVALLQAVLFIATLMITGVPGLRLALTPRALKRERVRQRAAGQFLAKSLHLTRERTGVLIYVSLNERMAELIADDGIASQVDKAVWDQAMAALTDGLKRGQPGAGFAAAVALCGDVLAQRFPPRPGDNPNELPDHVVVLPQV